TRLAPEEGSTLEQVVVPLVHGEQGAVAHTIELRYRFSDRRSRPVQGAMTLEGPTLPALFAARRTFWQVVLPADEHLWLPPENFTSEYTWSWSGMRWGRTPVLGQSELESWVGTRHDTPLPATVHSYLFSTTDADQALKLSVVRRSVLVLEASGLALVVGLVLVYWPAARQPLVFLVLAVATAALATLYPQPAIVLAEASALGLSLVVLAAALKRRFHDRRNIARPVRSGPSSIVERGSTRTQPHYRSSVAGSMSTTSGAELSMPIPETEAQR
ncbi:MAG TPA: hypothetical protein VG713_22710, partial [Pirellulales bacterium]|nr:hypothetical protein [Pirellulales bacterium]